MPMSMSDQLNHMTVRIECELTSGQLSYGTGFICNFCEGSATHVPVIISNKHVIEDARTGFFSMTLKGPDDLPAYGKTIKVECENFEARWIPHPDPAVDLAAFPIASILQSAEQDGVKLFYLSAPQALLADEEFNSSLNTMEEIVMVGYPIGMWDSKNNLPIFRKGITATPPFIDFEGKQEFIIDCACFPGSSGSPVFIYNTLGYHNKTGGAVLGVRARLIGILYAGPQHVAHGDIRVAPIPTACDQSVAIGIPTNLGYCIKATQLGAFEDHFRKVLGRQ